MDYLADNNHDLVVDVEMPTLLFQGVSKRTNGASHFMKDHERELEKRVKEVIRKDATTPVSYLSTGLDTSASKIQRILQKLKKE